MPKKLTFPEALEALKAGKRVRREAMKPDDFVQIGPKKAESLIKLPGVELTYPEEGYIALVRKVEDRQPIEGVDSSSSLVVVWHLTQLDVFADDWEVLP